MIDSDGHVIEPDSVWSEYAEPEFRELLPHGVGGYVQATGITRAYPDMPASFLTDQGDDHWEAVAEDTDWEEESKHKMARPGGYDPVARLVDMDAEGIDVAVLYPTAMLTWIEEADIFGAACRAYNNWLHDYCSAAPEPPVPGRRSSRCRTRDGRDRRDAARGRRPRRQGGDDPSGARTSASASSTIPRTTRSGPRPPTSTARSACTRHRTATWRTAAGCSASPTA